jgi:ATP-dependent protease ClpP protease subunit
MARMPTLQEILAAKSKEPSAVFEDKPVAHVHEFYLSGEIEDPEKYTEWFNKIRHSSASDVIKIYINSYGGSMFSALQFMRCMKECKATVIASVEGACMSAATIVLLMADKYEITPHSIFMFHNYSSGTMGKGGEMLDQIRAESGWSEALFKDVYKDFLTQQEITSIMSNKDIWMTSEEVLVRLNKLMLARRKRTAAALKATKKKK